nr:phosphotransferase [Cohnella lubricantis]
MSGGESGWNNTTRYVQSDGETYVLRLYETHRDEAKVRFEHETLLALAAERLPFAVPQPVRDRTGETHFRLNDGTERYGCLFAYLPGRRPDSLSPAGARAVGRAAGQLSSALARIRVNAPPVYPPYYKLDLAHPSCPPEKVADFCERPPAAFRSLAAELRTIHEEWSRFRSRLSRLGELPHQLVHGDINDSNMLAEEGNPNAVTAVIDFEFCTRDLRAMEPAVVLSALLDGEAANDTVPAFLEGYAENLKLSGDEQEAIPALVKLRKLDVFVHFLGRYLDGVDGEETLRIQTVSAATGLNRLREHEKQLAVWIERELR